jgi:ArsR family transcriptional regulator
VTGTRADRRLIKVAKALADETRFSILKVIARSGEASCGELARRFPVAQPTISHHTRVLVEAGLVTSRRAGQHSYFRLVEGALDALGPALVTALAARRRVAATARPRKSEPSQKIGIGRTGAAGRRGIQSRKPRSRDQRKGGTQT